MKFSTGLILAATAVTAANAGNSKYLRQPEADTLDGSDTSDNDLQYKKSSAYGLPNDKIDDDDLTVDLAQLFGSDIGSLDDSDLEVNILSLIGSGSNQVPLHEILEAFEKMGLNGDGSLDDLSWLDDPSIKDDYSPKGGLGKKGLVDDYDDSKPDTYATKGDSMAWLDASESDDLPAGKGGYDAFATKSAGASTKDGSPYSPVDKVYDDDEDLGTTNDAGDYKMGKSGKEDWLDGSDNDDLPMGKGGYDAFATKSAGASTKAGSPYSPVDKVYDDDEDLGTTNDAGDYKMGKSGKEDWLDGNDNDDLPVGKGGYDAFATKSAGASTKDGSPYSPVDKVYDDDEDLGITNDAGDYKMGKSGKEDWLDGSDNDDLPMGKGGYDAFATKSAGASTKAGSPYSPVDKVYDDDEDLGTTNDDGDYKMGKSGKEDWLDGSDNDDLPAGKGGYDAFATKSAGASTKPGSPYSPVDNVYDDDDDIGTSSYTNDYESGKGKSNGDMLTWLDSSNSNDLRVGKGGFGTFETSSGYEFGGDDSAPEEAPPNMDWLNDADSTDAPIGKGGYGAYATKSADAATKSDGQYNTVGNVYDDVDDSGTSNIVGDYKTGKNSKDDWLDGSDSDDVPMGKGGYNAFATKDAGAATKTGGQTDSVGVVYDDDSDEATTGDEDDLPVGKGTYKEGSPTWLDASESDDVPTGKGGFGAYATKSTTGKNDVPKASKYDVAQDDLGTTLDDKLAI